MTVPPASPRVLAIATVLPPQVCTREQSVAIAGQVFHDQPEAFAFIERLLMASGIEKRHTVIADYGRPMEERTFFPRTRDFRPEPTTDALAAGTLSSAKALTGRIRGAIAGAGRRARTD